MYYNINNIDPNKSYHVANGKRGYGKSYAVKQRKQYKLKKRIRKIYKVYDYTCLLITFIYLILLSGEPTIGNSTFMLLPVYINVIGILSILHCIIKIILVKIFYPERIYIWG